MFPARLRHSGGGNQSATGGASNRQWCVNPARAGLLIPSF